MSSEETTFEQFRGTDSYVVSDELRHAVNVAVALARPLLVRLGYRSVLAVPLLREERMIVSEMPGTTRDAVDTLMTWHRRQFRIVDTAGIRRPGRVATSGGNVS